MIQLASPAALGESRTISILIFDETVHLKLIVDLWSITIRTSVCSTFALHHRVVRRRSLELDWVGFYVCHPPCLRSALLVGTIVDAT